jgi:hypothetical protein
MATEYTESVRRLAEAIEFVGRQMHEWVRAGREPDRVHDRTKLLAELVREVQHQLEDAIDAHDAETIAATLIKRARDM